MDPVVVEFYSERAKVVNNFNRYQDLITQHGSESYPEIVEGLEDDMRTLEKLLKVPSTRVSIPSMIDMGNCLEGRVKRLNRYLADLKIAFEVCEQGHILKSVLEIAAVQVGLLRLLGVTDYHGDEMMAKARVLTEKYRPMNSNIDSYPYMRQMWKELHFARFFCNCVTCEAGKQDTDTSH